MGGGGGGGGGGSSLCVSDCYGGEVDGASISQPKLTSSSAPSLSLFLLTNDSTLSVRERKRGEERRDCATRW